MGEKELSEPQRKAIFLALVEAQDEAMSVLQSRKVVAKRFGVSDYVRRVTRVSTRLPTPRVADLLRQGRSKPVLVIEALNVDEAATPIEYGVGYSAGERLQLVFES